MGTPGYIDEKMGLIASLEEDWVGAAERLERAYIRSPLVKKATLLPALLRVKYETGAWDEAAEIASDLTRIGDLTGTPELFLGLILCRRPKRREEGIELLEKAAEVLGGSDRQRAQRALAELAEE